MTRDRLCPRRFDGYDLFVVYNAPDYDRMHNPDGNAANANDLIKYTRLLRNSRQDSGCIIFKPGAKKGLSTNSQCQLVSALVPSLYPWYLQVRKEGSVAV